MQIATYDSNDFHSLPGLAEADARRRGSAPDTLLKLGAVLDAYGYAEDIGLALLHRHFSLEPSTCLREVIAERSTITRTVAVGDLGEADVPHLFAIGSDEWEPLEYASVPSDHLARVRRVIVRLRDDAAFHASFRCALSELGLERVIGITVLHGREDLVRSEEALLETTDRTGRVSTLVPISQHELAEMKHYETVWLSDGATCRMSCSCQQMDGHEHYETN